MVPPTLCLSAQPWVSCLALVSRFPFITVILCPRPKETLKPGVEEGVVQVLARPELPHLALGELVDPQLARGMVGPISCQCWWSMWIGQRLTDCDLP